MWKPTARNFDGIQFETLRKQVDPKFNDLHDELSDCYYNKKPFREYGILTKEQFDKLHGLIFLKREIVFHEENLKLAQKDRIPEEQYNFMDETGSVKRTDFATQEIQKLKTEGIDLVIE